VLFACSGYVFSLFAAVFLVPRSCLWCISIVSAREFCVLCLVVFFVRILVPPILLVCAVSWSRYVWWYLYSRLRGLALFLLFLCCGCVFCSSWSEWCSSVRSMMSLSCIFLHPVCLPFICVIWILMCLLTCSRAFSSDFGPYSLLHCWDCHLLVVC